MKVFRPSLWALLVVVLCALSISSRPAFCHVPLQQALNQSWQHFKTRYMTGQQKVNSQTYGSVISEGQSYAMLMAWRMNDRTTFDKTWQWTKHHMQRPTDALLAWDWGKRDDGTWGIKDPNNATDADQDIAYALAKAGAAWARPDYTEDAKRIINDLWAHNVVKLQKRYYLTAGTWDGLRADEMLHQASGYFAPHVYRLFAKLDPAHPWQRVVIDGYQWIEACSQMTPSGLPPNWCGIRTTDETATWSDVQGEGSRDFGYDAIRIFWRMAQDRHFIQARQYALRHQALNHFWERNGNVPGGFNADGSPKWDMPTSYGRSALVAQWLVMSPRLKGNDSYQVALASQYNAKGFWQQDDNYFLPAVVWLSLSVGLRDW
jgi:endoglucanase